MKKAKVALALSLLSIAPACHGICACEPPPPLISSVKVMPHTDTLSLGDSVQLRAIPYDSHAHEIADPGAGYQIQWSASNSVVAALTVISGPQTTVRAVGHGHAEIVARAGNAADTALITVP